jgi:molybdate transport system substrate-binding protein
MTYTNKKSNITLILKKRFFILFIIFYKIIFLNTQSAYAENILIFAASSLTLPLQKITSTYHKKTANRVRISFASSSTLAQQISRGAPADIFISANIKWLDYLAKENTLVSQSKRKILSNKLVIISPKNQSLKIKNLSMGSLMRILKGGRLGIGNPGHVPLGMYSKQALIHLNLWQHLKNNTARLSNARAVLTFVERGETRAGIVYYSDTYLNKKVKIIFEFSQLTHNPIYYWAALTRSASPAASSQFFDILFNQKSKNIFKDHGFLVN